MKMMNILGGVASLAVIVASAGIYRTAMQAEAAVAHQETTEFQTPIPRPRPLSMRDAITDRDFECLVHNIYFEARGESSLGQRAVAWVTLNRVFDAQFPNTICEVVWEDRQFSWTHDGKSDTPRDLEALARAEEMALAVLAVYGVQFDPTEGATYFHNTSARPVWRHSFDRVVRIDDHIFYADNG